MKIDTISKVLLTGALLFPAAGLMAQNRPGEDPYKTMLEDAMKSGKLTNSPMDTWDIRLKRVAGTVSVKPGGSEKWSVLAGEAVLPLEPSDQIKVGMDGSAEIYLDDKGAISVGRGTEMEISAVVKSETAFTLKVGFLAAKIQHFLNESHKLQVRAPSAVCVLKGTEFAVQYSQMGKETGAAVFEEGKLSVEPADEKGQSLGEYMLEKNTELTFTPDQKRLKTVPLSKMRRYSANISQMRARLKVLKKSWKLMNSTKRQALRDRVFNSVAGRELGEEEESVTPKPKARAKQKVKARTGSKAVKKAKKAAPKAAYEDVEAE